MGDDGVLWSAGWGGGKRALTQPPKAWPTPPAIDAQFVPFNSVVIFKAWLSAGRSC